MEGSKGRAELQEGVDTMLAVLKCLNDSMHQVAITAFPVGLVTIIVSLHSTSIKILFITLSSKLIDKYLFFKCLYNCSTK